MDTFHFLGKPLEELKADAERACRQAIARRFANGLTVSGVDTDGKIVVYTQAQAEQLGAYKNDVTALADGLKANEPPQPR